MPEKLTQVWQLVPWSWNPWKWWFHLWPPAVVFLSGDGPVLSHPFQAVKEASTPGNAVLISEPKAQGARMCMYVCVGMRACVRAPMFANTLRAAGNLFSVHNPLRGKMSSVAIPLPFFNLKLFVIIYLCAYFHWKLRNITHELIMLKSREKNTGSDSSVCCCFFTSGNLRAGTRMVWYRQRPGKEGPVTIGEC